MNTMSNLYRKNLSPDGLIGYGKTQHKLANKLESQKQMKTENLNKVFENAQTTIWELTPTSFSQFLKENEIEDRHDLADEVFALSHTLLIEDGANWDEYGIVALDDDGANQTYEIVRDEDGKLVLSTEDAFWGPNYEQLINDLAEQLNK